MPRYKRSAVEAQLDLPVEPQPDPKDVETLSRLRNMWEFASLMQYIFTFGTVVKIDDDLDIEDLEAECIEPEPSTKLSQIGLALLKYVSSHRGLTPEIFDEYTRRQYEAKAPNRNPFGVEEQPAKFTEFDVFTKIRVLQQLSTWTFINHDRIRDLMPKDEDHLGWRIDPIGWDRDDRQYYVLDDNRLYRRTDAPLPPPSPKPVFKAKSKSKSKSKSRKSVSKSTRSSKRRKVETPEPEEEEEEEEAELKDDTIMIDAGAEIAEGEKDDYGDGLGGMTWECVAITLEEYQDFLATIFRSKDANEKALRSAIEQDVLPIIEKRAEAQRQKHLRKVREMENVQKLATAKRSSRLAGKAEKEKEERDAREAEDKRLAELMMAHEEQERQKRIEEGHESRRLTREQRLKEREVKRILHEEELAKLEEDGQRALSQDPNSAEGVAQAEKTRLSERHIKNEKEKLKAELERLAAEEDRWVFDCGVCGIHGENLDDGSHSISCETCGVWQHSGCHKITPEQAESEDFHFVCRDCRQKAEDAKKPKIKPLKLGRTSGSPKSERGESRPRTSSGLPSQVQRQLDGAQQQQPNPGYTPVMNGPSLSPHGQSHGPPGYHANGVPHYPLPPQQPWHGNALPPPVRPPSSSYQSSPPPALNLHPAQPRQQHQYAHQSAVASANLPPVHDAYRAHQNGYAQRQQYGAQPQPGTHHMAPPGHGPTYTSSAVEEHQAVHPQQQQQARPTSGQPQLMNGFQSPTKAKHSMSPPQQNAHAYQQQHRQALPQSPSSSFPPPSQDGFSAQRAGYSPMKSSSPPQYHQQHFHHQSQTPHALQTPTHLRPPAANGSAQRTPDMRPSSSHTTPINGMSGPWPETRNPIPEKHDTSPVPPSSAQTIGGTPVIPPIAALSPSPSMPAGGIPVKKAVPDVGATNGQHGA